MGEQADIRNKSGRNGDRQGQLHTDGQHIPFRKSQQTRMLSQAKGQIERKKLNAVVKADREYHETHQIDEDKQVYMPIDELVSLQNT